jgi:hypothetical protein
MGLPGDAERHGLFSKTSLPAQIGTFSIEFFTRGSTPSPRYQLANAVAARKTNKQSQERQQS